MSSVPRPTTRAATKTVSTSRSIPLLLQVRLDVRLVARRERAGDRVDLRDVAVEAKEVRVTVGADANRDARVRDVYVARGRRAVDRGAVHVEIDLRRLAAHSEEVLLVRVVRRARVREGVQ